VQYTLTALWADFIDLVFYVITATLLTAHFGLWGLALTRGLTFFLVAAILIYVLSRRHKLLVVDFSLLVFLGRTLLASAGMMVVSRTALHFLQPMFDQARTPLRLGVIGAVMAVSALAFLGIARLLKMDEVTHILDTIRQMIPGIPSAGRAQAAEPSIAEESTR
jgi:peptidoglycan biosynthesis protein MviN/MurJ (putative lipid II flippase)